jgi:precorrin-3B synthase
MTAFAINRPRRRGACPGLSAPMPTGDGLLVRLLPIGTIPLAAFAHLCAAARLYGNGIVEVTGRGSIQVRGLNARSAPRFADAIAALNIAAEDGVSVLSNALAGLDAEEILDANALATDLRRALSRTSLTARLAAKVSVAIDGGGALSLANVSADVRLCAEATARGARLRVGLAGDQGSATQVGAIAPADGVEAVSRLLEVIAQRGRTARARDILAAEGDAPFRSVLADLVIENVLPSENRNDGDPIGSHRLRDGSLAYGVGLAFGNADATTLERLVEVATGVGAIGIRAAADRVLMFIGLRQATASTFVNAAERLGFIVAPGDPRRRIVACAGAPICSSAHIAARALAPRIAGIAAAHLDGARQIHISGCAKGCAHAGNAALTIVGSPDGCALIANGSARDIPLAVIATDELPVAVERYFHAAAREDGHV